MFNKCVVFTAGILLLSSACFASIGQAQSCVVAPGSWAVNAGCVGSGAGYSMATISHCQMASSYCGSIAFQHQTCTVGFQTQISWCLRWPPCPPPCPPCPPCPPPCPPCPPHPPCPPPCPPHPPCPPPSEPPCTARGGDATATATAIGQGSVQASAHAAGGDAILIIK